MELKNLLLSLATLSLVKSETVLGVYIFSRHGDRTPKALAPTNLTSLGAEQVYTSGSYYRNRYVASDASSPVFGLSRDIAALTQLAVTAPVDNVLQSSAQAFLQGLYPPAGDFSLQKLRNDSSITAPLGGYQYIPVNIVSGPSTNANANANAENDPWLQGGSGCTKAVVSSNNYLASSEYATTYAESLDFYAHLLPVIESTFPAPAANFKNAYAIYDYINVATIHNTSIPAPDLLSDDTLRELKELADVQQWHLAYNRSDTIRAMAGSTLAGQILDALNATVHHGDSSSSTPKLNVQFGPYGTFLSFFGLAQLPAASKDDFTGVVEYASSMAFELVTNATLGSGPEGSDGYPSPEDVSVRFLFANGPAGVIEQPRPYPLFGQSETVLPWSRFVEEMSVFAIRGTAEWCLACGNTMGVCATTATTDGSYDEGGVGPTMVPRASDIPLPVAGVVGALVTLAVVLGALVLLYLFSGLRLVRKSTLIAQVAESKA